MPFLTHGGLSLHYQVHQSAAAIDHEPIVLLSGMASDCASWQPVVSGLGKDHQLIIPDNRCTGQTTPSPVDTCRTDMVADVLALLDSLAIERFHIVGHSMGGMLAWAIASAVPHRVSHLLAVAALPSISPARIALFKSLAALRSEQNEAHWFQLLYQFLFRPSFFDNNATVQSTVAASQSYPYKQGIDAFSQQVAGLASFLETPDISVIKCPITMITGRQDVLMPPEMLLTFSQTHPHIKTHIIEQAAHALHWEQPDAFTQCVLRALKRTP